MRGYVDDTVRRAILSEVVVARLARDSYRDRSMLATNNALSGWHNSRANEKAETIRALRRVLEQIRAETERNEATFLRAESRAELRGWAPGELVEAYGK